MSNGRRFRRANVERVRCQACRRPVPVDLVHVDECSCCGEVWLCCPSCHVAGFTLGEVIT